MSCNDNVYNMGCCTPVMAPADLYYTKSEVDAKIESGGTIDPTLYYKKSETSGATELATEFESYYKKSETSGATELATEFASYYKKEETSSKTEINNAVEAITDEIAALSAASEDWVTMPEVVDVVGTALIDYDTSLVVDDKIEVASDELKHDLLAHTSDVIVHTTLTEKTRWNAKSDFSGDYNDLTNKPEIPVVWNGTKAQFDAITVKDPNTLYLVNE